MGKKSFTPKKAWSRRYPAQTITDADYADDIAFLENTSTQTESLLPSLEQAAVGISLHVNEDKIEYMCFNQKGDISTLNGGSLKLVDKFSLGSIISSTENDINVRIAKIWITIDRLSIIWKSDLSDKIKRNFFQAAVVSVLIYGSTTWMLTKRIEKKLNGNCIRMLRAILNLMYNHYRYYDSVWFGGVLWHINHCRLFNVKSSLYILYMICKHIVCSQHF